MSRVDCFVWQQEHGCGEQEGVHPPVQRVRGLRCQADQDALPCQNQVQP